MRWRPVRAQRSVGFGVRAGRLLSLEMGDRGADAVGSAEGNIVAAFQRAVSGNRGVRTRHARDVLMLRTGRLTVTRLS